MMEAESLGKAGKTVDLGNAGQAGSQKKKGVYKIYQEKWQSYKIMVSFHCQVKHILVRNVSRCDDAQPC